MSSFTVALTTVGMMLLYAVPGFLFIRSGKLKAQSIPSFAVVLLYLCAPFQIIDAMQRIDFSAEMVHALVRTFLIGLVVMGGSLAASYLVTRKNQEDPRVRICTTATAFGNTGFMGIPLLEALLPDYPEAVAFASAFFIAMNLMMWTLGSAIITRDRKYIRLKKVVLNPTMITFLLALVFFFGRIKFTGSLSTFITMLSKMSTVLCMLILGMRLAVIPPQTDAHQRAAVHCRGRKARRVPADYIGGLHASARARRLSHGSVHHLLRAGRKCRALLFGNSRFRSGYRRERRFAEHAFKRNHHSPDAPDSVNVRGRRIWQIAIPVRKGV